MTEPATDVTRILKRWSRGEADARDQVIESVYSELKRVARAQLARERADHTLQPTALVNEAYLKLLGVDRIQANDRVHFIAVAARMMRQILIDSGRRRQAGKRNNDAPPSLLFGTATGQTEAVDLMSLDHALSALEARHPEQAKVVELRYFGGLTIEETAAAMDISPSTAKRHWRTARAWLFLRLGDGGSGSKSAE
jgi:RNA polymerase sigma factor (TIGR02999 family)